MMLPPMNMMTKMDALALLFFISAWVSYVWFADIKSVHRVSLMTVMNTHRLHWMRQMLRRENRMMDATMIGNLLRSISFFANTSIFILFGLVTLFRYRENASQVIAVIPFSDTATPVMWEIKIFLLAIIFIYAFFKYTWSLRQYNYACIYVAAAPAVHENTAAHEDYAHKGARLIANAAKHFNNGLRAYYFGLAALAWFINAPTFFAITALVVAVLYRREFRSHTLNNLAEHSQIESL